MIAKVGRPERWEGHKSPFKPACSMQPRWASLHKCYGSVIGWGWGAVAAANRCLFKRGELAGRNYGRELRQNVVCVTKDLKAGNRSPKAGNKRNLAHGFR